MNPDYWCYFVTFHSLFKRMTACFRRSYNAPASIVLASFIFMIKQYSMPSSRCKLIIHRAYNDKRNAFPCLHPAKCRRIRRGREHCQYEFVCPLLPVKNPCFRVLCVLFSRIAPADFSASFTAELKTSIVRFCPSMTSRKYCA